VSTLVQPLAATPSHESKFHSTHLLHPNAPEEHTHWLEPVSQVRPVDVQFVQLVPVPQEVGLLSHTHWRLALHVVPVPQSRLLQHDELAMQKLPHSFGVEPEQTHLWFVASQALPTVQLAMQVPPQSSGVFPKQTHWLLWQTLLVPHWASAVQATQGLVDSKQWEGVPPQLLSEVH
jgi:hypothetical protein